MTLPAPGQRWVASRKEAVVYAIEAAEISEAAALERYGISLEELNRWRSLLAWGGRRALNALHREQLP